MSSTHGIEGTKHISCFLSCLLICATLFSQITRAQSTPTIEFGNTLLGTIECGGASTYSFTGAAGDEVLAHVTETSDFGGICGGVAAFQFDQCVELRDDTQELLRASCTPIQGNAGTKYRTEIGPVRLPRNGTYTLTIRDANGRGRGTYTAFLQKTRDPRRPDLLVENAAMLLPFQARGEVRTLTFQAAADASVNIVMRALTGSVSPRLSLYGPDGRPVSLPENGEIHYDVTQSGVHTLLAFSDLDELGVADILLSTSSNHRQIVSQIADGAGWRTGITLVNLDSVPAPYVLNFWASNGSPLPVSIDGVTGAAATISGTLPVNGVRTISTNGAAQALSQGWAELIADRKIDVLAVFRQRVPGRADQEAAVTATSGSKRFVLPFDNSDGFVTSAAVVNTNPSRTAEIAVTIRNEGGAPLATHRVTLPPRAHMAFALPTRFGETGGIRGGAEFEASIPDITGLGLRFHGEGAFTSFPVGRK
jgi:hypothetical protein